MGSAGAQRSDRQVAETLRGGGSSRPARSVRRARCTGIAARTVIAASDRADRVAANVHDWNPFSSLAAPWRCHGGFGGTQNATSHLATTSTRLFRSRKDASCHRWIAPFAALRVRWDGGGSVPRRRPAASDAEATASMPRSDASTGWRARASVLDLLSPRRGRGSGVTLPYCASGTLLPGCVLNVSRMLACYTWQVYKYSLEHRAGAGQM